MSDTTVGRLRTAFSCQRRTRSTLVTQFMVRVHRVATISPRCLQSVKRRNGAVAWSVAARDHTGQRHSCGVICNSLRGAVTRWGLRRQSGRLREQRMDLLRSMELLRVAPVSLIQKAPYVGECRSKPKAWSAVKGQDQPHSSTDGPTSIAEGWCHFQMLPAVRSQLA